MRSNENYLPHIAAATLLTLAIFVSFQVFILREPARITAAETYHKNVAIAAGKDLFTKNCATCHGVDGEGSDDAPALNNKQFLISTDDGTIFSIASSGVPDTQMPAWNQSHGGPLTDEDINNVVAFIRSWQPGAPDITMTVKPGDAGKGEVIFSSTCFICHGQDGKGTDRAPALNDPTRLHQFDDAWYRDTIMNGRPSKGMPTWGTVLSPEQVNNVIALIDQWRTAASSTSAPAATPTPQAGAAVTETSSVTSTATTTATADIARPSNPGGPGPALNLAGDIASGSKVFADQCAKCHGQEGTGGVNNPGSDDGAIPPLNPIDDTLVSADPKVFAYNIDLFMEHGSTPSGSNPKEVMPAWGDEKKLIPQQIADVIAYVMSLNKK
ncbi:MAG: c-type cytochrome [Chloroflexi bacterium]|nr:c-type cytochrome [Chloroflexota bacterium]MCL5275607.1 c-type cytochrome [Chloroflexota bacterium]